MNPYQFNFVIQGIKRQIPVYKSLYRLKITSFDFYNSLSNAQLVCLHETRALYSVKKRVSINVLLAKHNITFDEGYTLLLSQYTL